MAFIKTEIAAKELVKQAVKLVGIDAINAEGFLVGFRK